MRNIDANKLDKNVQDLKKIVDAEKLIGKLEFMQEESHVERYLNYILDNEIVSSLEEVFYLVQKVPEVSEPMANCLRINKMRGKLVHLSVNIKTSCDRDDVSGIYKDLRDVPGYGTEWNERCIPEGVIIRHSNDRC